jgi:hypothetical protein
MSTQSNVLRAASNPVAAVGSLTQMIREECAVVDRTRAIPATVAKALRDAGVFRLLVPPPSAAPRPSRSPSFVSSRRCRTPTAPPAGAP